MGRLLTILAAILLGPASVGIAAAQNYPTRPITVIVPFPAGGATDTLARFLAEQMRPILGQPVVIENVGGADGSLGVGRAVRSAADAERRHLDHAYADRRPLRAAVRSV
jgi:tripartite-type tricarboxylate transporter receptor subunit TctC